MKTLESVISARASQLDKYKADKDKAMAKAKDFSQTVTDSLMADLTMPNELKETAKEYRKTNSAIELAYLPEYKDKFRNEDKSVNKLKVREEAVRLCDKVIESAEPMTEDFIKEVTPLFTAITKRMEKLAKNFDIQIGDAEKDLLLYRLIEVTRGNPVHPAGFTEFLDNLLKDEPKKADDDMPVPEVGWTMAQLEEEYTKYADKKGKSGKAWEYIGKALSKYGLKPGAGGKLVAC